MPDNAQQNQTPEDKAQTQSKKKRRWPKVLLVAVILSIGLVAAVIVAAPDYIVPRVVRWQASANLSAAWDGEVTIETIDFSYTEPTRLGGIAVTGRDGRTWLTVGEVVLTLDNWPGISPVLTEVAVRDVDATVYLENGRPVQEPKPLPETEGGESPYVDLRKVTVEDVNVTAQQNQWRQRLVLDSMTYSPGEGAIVKGLSGQGTGENNWLSIRRIASQPGQGGDEAPPSLATGPIRLEDIVVASPVGAALLDVDYITVTLGRYDEGRLVLKAVEVGDVTGTVPLEGGRFTAMSDLTPPTEPPTREEQIEAQNEGPGVASFFDLQNVTVGEVAMTVEQGDWRQSGGIAGLTYTPTAGVAVKGIYGADAQGRRWVEVARVALEPMPIETGDEGGATGASSDAPADSAAASDGETSSPPTRPDGGTNTPPVPPRPDPLGRLVIEGPALTLYRKDGQLTFPQLTPPSPKPDKEQSEPAKPGQLPTETPRGAPIPVDLRELAIHDIKVTVAGEGDPVVLFDARRAPMTCSPDGTRVTCKNLSGQIAQGRMDLDFSFNNPPDAPLSYEGKLILGEVSLPKLMEALGTQGVPKGKVDLMMVFSGFGTNPKNFRCQAQTRMIEGHVGKLPILGPLIRFVGLGHPGAFDAYAYVTLREGVVTFREAKMANPYAAFEVEPGGTFNIETQTMDFYVMTALFNDLKKAAGDIPVLDFITTMGDKVAEAATRIHVKGKVTEPPASWFVKEPIEDMAERTSGFIEGVFKTGGKLGEGILKPIDELMGN
jgi:hypothetical protein